MASKTFVNPEKSSRYFLVLFLITQLFNFFFFLSANLNSLLPKEIDPVLDFLYEATGPIKVLLLISLFCFSLYNYFIHFEDKRLKVSIALSTFVLGYFGFYWPLLLLLPIQNTRSFSKIKRSIPRIKESITQIKDKKIALFPLLAGTILLASFLLASRTVSFRLEPFKEILYFYGFSTYFLLLGIGYIGVSFFVLGRIISYCKKTFKTSFDLNSLFLILFIFIYSSYYSWISLEIIVSQNGWKLEVLNLGSLFTTIFLLHFSRINSEFNFSKLLFSLQETLTKRFFWPKFILIALLYKNIYFLLISGEQHFLTYFGYDIVGLFFPFSCFQLGLGLYYKLSSFLSNKKIFSLNKFLSNKKIISLNVFLILLLLIFPFRHITEDWTVYRESAHPFSFYISSNVRKVFYLFKLPVKRKQELFYESLSDLNKKDIHLKPSDLFKNKEGNYNTYKATKPNIFFFVSDSIYANHLSTYGYSKKTSPELTKFAEDAIILKNMYSTGSATMVAVASLFSGDHVGNFPYLKSKKRDTLCRVLEENNYTQLLASAFSHAFLAEEKEECLKYKKLSYYGNTKSDYDKISKNLEVGSPHFAYMHISGGHSPWSKDKEETFGNDKRANYDKKLFNADKLFGEFLAFLKKKGVYENSVIIFTSDHGIGLGYHRDQLSYDKLFDVNTHIPFLIKIPGAKAKTLKNYYSLIDVRPTLEHMLKGEYQRGKTHGISFLDSLYNEEVKSDRCIFSIATYRDRLSMQCPNQNKIYFIRDKKIVDIFDAKKDPYELHSLANETSRTQFEKMVIPLLSFMKIGENSFAKEF